MRAVTISLFAFLLVTAATVISFCDGKSNVLCIESERQALLKFKHDLIDHSNRLSSWFEGDHEDCCNWVGVLCDNKTGHVNQLHLGRLMPEDYATNAVREVYDRSKLGGKINPSLLDLKHLSFLDLSNNDFGGMQIPQFIGSLKSLTYLNLSWANFRGAIPHELGNLSKLHYLDLGYNSQLEAKTLQWVSSLPSRHHLDLSYVNLSKATDWLQVTNKLPYLVELHLLRCNLNNDPSPVSVNYTSLAVLDLSSNTLSSVPTWIFSLRSLASLDLNWNSLNEFSLSSIPSGLSNLSHLQFLGLRGIGLQDNIWSAIGKLSSVTHLDLSYNQLEGTMSQCLKSLRKLREMDLSNNKIDEKLSKILQSFPRCNLDNLSH